MESTHTHTHTHTLMNKVKTVQQKYSRLTQETKEIKKLYLPVENKINSSTNWKKKLEQGAKWGIKQ